MGSKTPQVYTEPNDFWRCATAAEEGVDLAFSFAMIWWRFMCQSIDCGARSMAAASSEPPASDSTEGLDNISICAFSRAFSGITAASASKYGNTSAVFVGSAKRWSPCMAVAAPFSINRLARWPQ